jgi:ketosteroid isomerase-like protein
MAAGIVERMTKTRRARETLVAVAVAMLCHHDASAGATLSAEARSAASAATLAYRDAWLSNLPERVMATLTADAILMPSGMEPISGAAAIRAFWWPAGGPAATITVMEQTIDEVTGEADLAIVRGRGSLTFTMSQDGRESTRSQRSTFVNVIRRQADGSWKITLRMWSDLKGP